MIDLISVSVTSINFKAQGYEEVFQSLKILFTTPVGTVPFDREFGIDFSILDNPLQITQGKLIVEYTEKTKKYEPRATVKEVNFIPNPETGLLMPKVVIEIVSNIE